MPEFTTGWLSLISGASKHLKLNQHNLSNNAEVTDDGSGTIYAEFLALTGWAPVMGFQTGAVATAISQFGLSGACIGEEHTITAARLISRKVGTCDSPLGGTPHFQHALSKGFGMLRELSAGRNQDATISGDIHALSASGNAPLAETDGVAEPSPLVSERFRLAISKIAGVQFPQIQNLRLGWEIQLSQKDPALTGQVSPENVGVLAVRPTVELIGTDLSRVKSGLIELSGNGATHLNTTFQLAALKDQSSFHDFGDNEHVEVTAYGLAVPDELTSASAGSRATNSIRLTTANDGVNAPLVFTVGTSILASP